MVWAPKYAKRRDVNEPAIFDALKAEGYRVKRQDDWDLVVGNIRTGRVCLLEVKHNDPKARNDADRRHGGLTPAQRVLHIDEDWGRFIHIVRTVNEAKRVAAEQTGDA